MTCALAPSCAVSILALGCCCPLVWQPCAAPRVQRRWSDSHRVAAQPLHLLLAEVAKALEDEEQLVLVALPGEQRESRHQLRQQATCGQGGQQVSKEGPHSSVTHASCCLSELETRLPSPLACCLVGCLRHSPTAQTSTSGPEYWPAPSSSSGERYHRVATYSL